MSRPPKHSRSERIALGLTMCATPDCHRTVAWRGLCRPCASGGLTSGAIQPLKHGRQLPANSPKALRVPDDLWAMVVTTAAGQCISAAEFTRRALVRALEEAP